MKKINIDKVNWSHWFECMPGMALKCRIIKKLKWINMYKIFTEESTTYYVHKSSIIKRSAI